MNHLSAQDILSIWERGLNEHSIDRALTILEVACQDMDRNKLATLTIAQRDTILLNIREEIFGPTFKGFAECPQCTENLVFTISTNDIREKEKDVTFKNEHSLKLRDNGIELIFRLPTSVDLAAVLNCGEVQAARNLLVQRCLLQVKHNDERLSENKPSVEVLDRLIERMSECGSESEILIDLLCTACSHRWQVTFDIAAFLWSEIDIHAKRLMREVHILASAYKWSEADILAMSAIRRQCHLDMVS
jgi:hypothetical protein